MEKEVRTAPADLPCAGVITGTALGKRLRPAMVFCAIAGMLVGVLNFLAIEYRWKLAGFFDILDFPFLSLMDVARDPFYPYWFSMSHGPGPIADADIYGPDLLCGIICYWTFIGWFLAALFCLVRTGIIVEVVRKKAGRWMLFFGACGGMFIGCLNFLAASNGWEELERCFDGLDRPINWLMRDVQIRCHYLPADPTARFVYSYVALVVYWAVIGFLVAWMLGAAWIVGKRIAAGKTRYS